MEEHCTWISSNYCAPKKCLENLILLGKELKIGKEIGEGGYGTVFDACYNSECNYVIKIIDLKAAKEDSIYQYNFNTEISLTIKASENNIAPLFKKSFVC